jgi:hypothetical protein
MPKVPIYEGNQVQSTGAPAVGFTAQTTPDTYGPDFLKPIEQAANKVNEIYQEQKRKADQIAVYEANAKLSEIENKLLYDQKDGALNKRGKDSFDLPFGVNENYGKMSNEILNSLTNDEQKMAFKRYQIERGAQIDRTVQRHVSGEILRYDNDVTTNFIKNEQDAAIKSYKDPSRVMLSLENQKKAIADFGQRNGLSKEEIDQKSSALVSATHKEIISRMITNDEDMAAMNYYKTMKDQIKGSDLGDVEKLVEAGSLRGSSQRFVDNVMKEGLDETKALEKARSISDPKLRDATVDRIRNEFNIKDAAEKNKLEDLHVNALNMIDNGQVKDLYKIPGWNEMGVSQRNSLENYMQSKISGANIKTDPAVYYDLKTMASIPETRDKFLKMNLMEKRNSLDNGDFEKMVDLQAKLRAGKPEGAKIADGFRSDAQVVKQTYDAAGLPKNNKEKISLFNTRVEQASIAEQERLGRKLNNLELKKLADEQAMKIVTKERSFWFDEEKTLAEATDEELLNLRYKDVPSADKIKIESSLNKKGIPVNEETVRKMYIEKIMRTRNVGK